MKRQHQIVLIGSTVALAWLWMQAVHELGHVIGAWVTGGRVAQVVLHPATISQTRLAENPSPLMVAWMGPLVGVGLPLVILAAARFARLPGWYLLQFFAGFCCVANGAYLLVGSLSGAGDAGDLLRFGTPIWLLWLFGAATIPAGLWLWHRLGPHFGLGAGAGQVGKRAAYVVLTLLVVTVALEIAFA